MNFSVHPPFCYVEAPDFDNEVEVIGEESTPTPTPTSTTMTPKQETKVEDKRDAEYKELVLARMAYIFTSGSAIKYQLEIKRILLVLWGFVMMKKGIICECLRKIRMSQDFVRRLMECEEKRIRNETKIIRKLTTEQNSKIEEAFTPTKYEYLILDMEKGWEWANFPELSPRQKKLFCEAGLLKETEPANTFKEPLKRPPPAPTPLKRRVKKMPVKIVYQRDRKSDEDKREQEVDHRNKLMVPPVRPVENLEGHGRPSCTPPVPANIDYQRDRQSDKRDQEVDHMNRSKVAPVAGKCDKLGCCVDPSCTYQAPVIGGNLQHDSAPASRSQAFNQEVPVNDYQENMDLNRNDTRTELQTPPGVQQRSGAGQHTIHHRPSPALPTPAPLAPPAIVHMLPFSFVRDSLPERIGQPINFRNNLQGPYQPNNLRSYQSSAYQHGNLRSYQPNAYQQVPINFGYNPFHNFFAPVPLFQGTPLLTPPITPQYHQANFQQLVPQAPLQQDPNVGTSGIMGDHAVHRPPNIQRTRADEGGRSHPHPHPYSKPSSRT